MYFDVDVITTNQRHDGCRHSRLVLNQLAPKLAQLPAGLVPMPQTATSASAALSKTGAGSEGFLTIEKVDGSVKVLNTKTRPKRLQFLGSDGHTYRFLLKVGQQLCIQHDANKCIFRRLSYGASQRSD